MGMSLTNRFFQGIRSAVNTVSVAEAHMAKTKKVEGPKTFPELGVLQFGSRFRSMEGMLNPFTSGVRPAMGPTIGRPGLEQFKGTGGAFAPEQTLQMTSGFRNLGPTLGQLERVQGLLSNNPSIQQAPSQVGQFNVGNLSQLDVASPGQFQGAFDAAGVPADMQRMFFMNQAMQQIERLAQLISTILKAAHDVAMNSIRNMKG